MSNSDGVYVGVAIIANAGIKEVEMGVRFCEKCNVIVYTKFCADCGTKTVNKVSRRVKDITDYYDENKLKELPHYNLNQSGCVVLISNNGDCAIDTHYDDDSYFSVDADLIKNYIADFKEKYANDLKKLTISSISFEVGFYVINWYEY